MQEVLCKKFCAFYKPEKEVMKCGTYCFLERNLSIGELRQVVDRIPRDFDCSRDEDIRKLVCDKCDFKVDGCDYVQGLDSPPCGGYVIIENLLKSPLVLRYQPV